jgi:hypothetical protein
MEERHLGVAAHKALADSEARTYPSPSDRFLSPLTKAQKDGENLRAVAAKHALQAKHKAAAASRAKSTAPLFEVFSPDREAPAPSGMATVRSPEVLSPKPSNRLGGKKAKRPLFQSPPSAATGSKLATETS